MLEGVVSRNTRKSNAQSKIDNNLVMRKSIQESHLRNRFLKAESTSRLVVGNQGVPIHQCTVRNCLLACGIRWDTTGRTHYQGLSAE